MHTGAADLLFVLSLVFGLPSLVLPLAFAIRARDLWATVGVICLLSFCLVVLAWAGSKPLALGDQFLAAVLWLAAVALALAAHYSPSRSLAEKENE